MGHTPRGKTTGRAALGALALTCALALGASAALAAIEPPFDFCSLSSGELGGQCNTPRGVAIDETGNGGVPAGSVYLADFQNRRIQSFDGEGNFLRAWGWDVIQSGKPGDAGTGFEICAVAADCKRGESGGGAGQFNGNAGGIAVNQSSGDVYVVDRNNFRVQQFDATGHFIRTWGADVDSAGGSGFEVCTVAANCKAGLPGGAAGQFNAPVSGGALSGIGVDSSGNVYVADSGNSRVQKFSSAGAFLATGGWDVDAVNPASGYEVCTVAANCKAGVAGSGAGQFANQNPNHLAIDPAGEVYAVDEGNGKVVRLDSTLALVKDPFAAGVVAGGGALKAIVVNWADGHLLLAKSGTEKIFEIDPVSEAEPAPPTLFGASNWLGLAINSTNGWIYAASGQTTTVGHIVRVRELKREVFAVTKPASGVTDTTARLNGEVNPGGDPVSECVFEYGTTAAYGQTAPCAESEAEIGAGISFVPVHADLGLHPGTPYHFRLFARGAVCEEIEEEEVCEESLGADMAFQTLGPVIADSWTQEVGLSEARLRAKIDPEGKASTFHVEWGLGEAPYEHATAETAVGSDSAVHEVGALLEGLSGDATYHWRVVVTDADAVVNEGPDHSFTTYAPLSHGPCANDAFRVGPSAALPDCRAYEMVSPLDKNGGNISVPSGSSFGRVAAYRQASLDGNRVTYTSENAFGDALRSTISNQYLASRHPLGDPQQGWTTHALYPPQGTTVFDPKSSGNFDLDINFQAFTPDLCFALMRDHNLVPLTEEALAGYTDLYVRDNCGPGADSYRAVTVGEPPTVSVQSNPKDLQLQGRNYSTDLGHVVFSAQAALDSTPPPAPTSNSQIYDFSGGALHLVSVLPGGEANPDVSEVGSPPEAAHDSNLTRAVSADGSRVFWTSRSAIGGIETLYARIDGAQTLQLSGTGAGVVFWTATPDGRKALFSEGSDLYEFDLDKALAEEAAKTLIAHKVGSATGSSENGGVVGASEDLTSIYFTSKEVLDPNPNPEGDVAIAGKRNLYLRREGTIGFIAMLSPAKQNIYAESSYAPDASSPSSNSSRVSPDGRYLTFMSLAALSGYDNTDQVTGEAAAEVYRYDAGANGGAGELACVSCNPSGARPTGQDPRAPYSLHGPAGFEAAAWLPTSESSNYAKRSLSEDGRRLFFHAFDALVPEDTNGAQDVYQWEAPGTGTCTSEDPRYFAQNGGCLHLISSGRSTVESELLDATPDGRDVFITTASSIDPRDHAFVDVYDARAGGGFPPPPPPKPICLGDACQSVPAPPQDPTPASAGFAGAGNPPPQCRKGKIRRKGRCVPKHKRAHRRRADHSRGRPR